MPSSGTKWGLTIYHVIGILYILVKTGKCSKPNIVIFIADDLGFGDLQGFGNPLSNTPNLDALQREGLKLTQMYSAAPICSSARAGLLTGRYPVRSGVWNDDIADVFSPKTVRGLPLNETTIPEMLAYQGYKSAIVGKWHLGVGADREYLPLNQGFDHYFGMPYSHEGCKSIACFAPDVECEITTYPNNTVACPLMLENDIIEQPLNLSSFAERMTKAARSWIREFSCEGSPFFLYYASLHPHTPHYASDRHRHVSMGGEFTDSLVELDWEFGEVMDELRKNNLLENTLIIFTSDNGPDRGAHIQGGFSGPLRCGKFSTFDGGSQVPTIAYWLGHIESGISRKLLSHLDIWPTLRRLSGSPADYFDVVLDGYDITDVLINGKNTPRESLLYYDSGSTPKTGAFAVRNTQFKAHFITKNSRSADFDDIDSMCRAENDTLIEYSPPLVYDLLLDPEERFDISNDNDTGIVVEMMIKLMKEESSKVNFGPSVLKLSDKNIKLCCDPECEPYPSCCECPSLYTNDLLPYIDCTYPISC